jgi:catechol 2,3-dioxygenase
MIKISTLGHLVLRTPDLGRSLAFYRDILGLDKVASEEFDGQQWAFLTSGRTHHELALVEDPSRGPAGPLHHLGFKVGNSDGFTVRLARAADLR